MGEEYLSQVGLFHMNDEYYLTMNLDNLDLDTLRTLDLAHELGSYGQAAAQLGRSASAISLQMKRLQEAVGVSLFEKNGRGVRLTEAGEMVLGYGRRMLALNDELLHSIRGALLAGNVRLGFSQDFAESVLPGVLKQFAKFYPLIQMEVHIEGNAALADAIEEGRLDVALAVGQAERSTAEMVAELELVWIAGEEFSLRNDQPVPLVVLGPQCAFRKKAIQELDAKSIPWRIAAVSPSLAGLWASAIGGLGVTVRSGLGLPSRLVSDATMFGLPPLGKFPVTLHGKHGSMSDAVERLSSIVRAAVSASVTGAEIVKKSRRSPVKAPKRKN